MWSPARPRIARTRGRPHRAAPTSRQFFHSFSAELLQRLEQFVILGLIPDRMNVFLPDDPFLVDNKQVSLGNSFTAKNSILYCDKAMGPEIAQQWVRDPAHGVCPRLVARYVIHAYAQHLASCRSNSGRSSSYEGI